MIAHFREEELCTFDALTMLGRDARARYATRFGGAENVVYKQNARQNAGVLMPNNG